MSLLKEYLEEFDALRGTVETAIDEFLTLSTEEQRRQTWVKVEEGLLKLKQFLRVCELESCGDKEGAQAVKQRNSLLDKLRQQWRVNRVGSSGLSGQTTPEARAASRACAALTRMECGTEKLTGSLRLAAESEARGLSTMRNLGHQAEVLSKSRAAVAMTHENISESNTVLNRVSRWWNAFL